MVAEAWPTNAPGVPGGGESGIRTHGTLLTYTRFPSVRLKPLGHLSTAEGGGLAGRITSVKAARFDASEKSTKPEHEIVS